MDNPNLMQRTRHAGPSEGRRRQARRSKCRRGMLVMSAEVKWTIQSDAATRQAGPSEGRRRQARRSGATRLCLKARCTHMVPAFPESLLLHDISIIVDSRLQSSPPEKEAAEIKCRSGDDDGRFRIHRRSVNGNSRYRRQKATENC